MKARVAIVVCGLVFLSSGWARAVTDTAVVAQGNGTFFYGTPVVTCTAPVAIGFTAQSNHAIYVENWLPALPGPAGCTLATLGTVVFATNANPQAQLCTPIDIWVPGYTLSQAGATYTLFSSIHLCSGAIMTDRIVVTVRPTNITFTHTYAKGATVLAKTTGTIPRAA